MATAADTVILETGKIVERGELDANQVMTPGIFIDYIVFLGNEYCFTIPKKSDRFPGLFPERFLIQRVFRIRIHS